jgi:hypothetical protein
MIMSLLISSMVLTIGHTLYPGFSGASEPVIPESTRIALRSDNKGPSANDPKNAKQDSEPVWRSQELNLLGVGLGVGDVDGDGKNEVAIAGPGSVYLYRKDGEQLYQMDEYSSGSLEVKSIDVAAIRKGKPARIYVSAQNRGSIESFVLEVRGGKLARVIHGFPYFLRVIQYPTQGPFLLAQGKSLSRMYDGPVMQVQDLGDKLEIKGRFGVPLKIPVFGFAIGDLEGEKKPIIAVYDRNDRLRLYRPKGKRLYKSQEYYGGSDVVLRMTGITERTARNSLGEEMSRIYMRPRIMSLDLNGNGKYEVLAIKHSSATMRMMANMRMLRDGQVIGLEWNGDALEPVWESPPVQGMVMGFTVDNLPGLPGKRLITLERKKTDWLSFLSSKSQVRAYDINYIVFERKL